MKNIQRSPDYINIAHKIKSCEKLKHLRSMIQLVLVFVNESTDDEASDMIEIYNKKEKQLGVSIDHFPFPVAIFGSNVSKLNTL